MCVYIYIYNFLNLPAKVGDVRDMGSVPELAKSPGGGSVPVFQGMLQSRRLQRVGHYCAQQHIYWIASPT